MPTITVANKKYRFSASRPLTLPKLKELLVLDKQTNGTEYRTDGKYIRHTNSMGWRACPVDVLAHCGNGNVVDFLVRCGMDYTQACMFIAAADGAWSMFYSFTKGERDELTRWMLDNLVGGTPQCKD